MVWFLISIWSCWLLLNKMRNSNRKIVIFCTLTLYPAMLYNCLLITGIFCQLFGIFYEIKLPTSAGSLKKQESSRKTSTSALLTMPKPLTVWITINCGNFWKRWEYQTTWPASWGTYMQVRKQQLELDMEQQTGSK